MLFISKDAFKALSLEDQAIYVTRSNAFKLKANGYVVNNATILSARPLSNGNVLMSLSDKVITSVIVPKTICENAYTNGVSSSISRMLPNLTNCTISFTAEVSLTGDNWIDKAGVASARTSNTLVPIKPTLMPTARLLMVLETVSETLAQQAAQTQRAPIIYNVDDLARVDD